MSDGDRRPSGKPPIDVLFELLIENGGSVPTVYFHHAEEDMRYALAQPFVSDRLGRHGGHDRGPAGARQPAPALLRHLPARARTLRARGEVLTLEEAIRKMTSANAAKIRVYDRGLLRPGQWADVTVFDAAASSTTRPSRSRTSTRPASSTSWSTAGRARQGKHTQARPGQVFNGQGLNTRR